MDDVKLKIKKVWPILWKISFIFLYFIMLVIIAQFHEHWSDEAQAFLLARDNNFIELFKYLKYEGTPPLWHIILKIFIMLGGSYKSYFIVPIIFTTIGVGILEFKKDIPYYFKLLLPFTYFIFYQYAIVARSYCLIFPMLMIVSYTYCKKESKPIIFAISLIPLMMISLHTLLIAGSLFALFIIDIIKRNKISDKKNIVSCIIIFLGLLSALIMAYPSSDCYYSGVGIHNIIKLVTSATISSYYIFGKDLIIFCVLGILMFYMFYKDTDRIKHIIILIGLFLPITALMLFINCNEWHYGILTIMLIFYFIITKMIDKNKVCKILLIFVCIIQILWSIKSINYDYSNFYSASKSIAKYVENNIIKQNKTVCGLGFSVTAIQGYLDKNVFLNQNPQDKAFWSWSKKNSTEFDSVEKLIQYNADVYIISKFYANEYQNIIRYLKNSNYILYEFDGFTYIKTHKYESEGYYVYEKVHE